MKVEESGGFGEGVGGFGGVGDDEIFGVGGGFEDEELGFDAGFQKLLVDADGVAEEEVARAGDEDGGWESGEVSVDGGKQRLFAVVGAGVKLGGGVQLAVFRAEDVVDVFVGEVGVAGLGEVGPGCAGQDGCGQRQVQLFETEDGGQGEASAGGGAEEGKIFGGVSLEHFFPNRHGVIDGRGEGVVGGHAVVDGEDLRLAVVSHDDSFSKASATGERDVAAAMHVDQQAIAIFGGDGVGIDEVDVNAGDGLLFVGNMELLFEGCGLHGLAFVARLDQRLPLIGGER